MNKYDQMEADILKIVDRHTPIIFPSDAQDLAAEIADYINTQGWEK